MRSNPIPINTHLDNHDWFLVARHRPISAPAQQAYHPCQPPDAQTINTTPLTTASTRSNTHTQPRLETVVTTCVMYRGQPVA